MIGLYSEDSTHGKVWLAFVSALIFSLAISLSVCAGDDSGNSDTKEMGSKSTTWTVLVGGQASIGPGEYGPSGAWQFMRFYPDNITINAGDKILWILDSAEPHTVTFPGSAKGMPDLIIPENNSSNRLIFNPFVVLTQGGPDYDGSRFTGSGQMDMQPTFPQEYNLTFTKPGEFDYYCGFHKMMKGRVTVHAAGTPYPETQDQINADSMKMKISDMEAALKAWPGANNVSSLPGPNNTMKYEVKMGYGDGYVSLMRFVPTNLTINAGDIVEWTQGDTDMPHTVTFLSGAEEPEMVLAEPQQQGPPKLVLNPVVLAPAGGKVYSGKEYYNSGLIWGTRTPMLGPRSYNLTFDTPGTYDYVCVLHDSMGMKGQIKVLPRNNLLGNK